LETDPNAPSGAFMPNLSRLNLLLCSILVLTACAQKSEDITAAYVSPNDYNGYSCAQLREEAHRMASRASSAMSTQDKAAQNDGTAVAVSAILFWPALFFIKGDKATATEVAELKGQIAAIEKANITKGCGIKFQNETGPSEAYFDKIR
jgi:hypothetical protein